jgi:hypothetical protein
MLRSGQATVATFVTAVRQSAQPVVFALSIEGSE